MPKIELPFPGKRDSETRLAAVLLLLLLSADVAFVLAHFFLAIGLLNDPLFSLEKDRGYSEFFQYVKILAIVALLFAVFARTKTIGFGVWALLFFYLLLDDALQIHEVFGGHIATGLNFVPAMGLRAQDFGEVAVSAIAAALFLPAIAFFYIRGTGQFRKASRYLLLLFVALAFFGIFIDLLHVSVKMGWRITWLLGVIEDGGEMVIVSIMVWYVFLLRARDGDIGDFSPVMEVSQRHS